MDASFVPVESGTNEAPTSCSLAYSSSLSNSSNLSDKTMKFAFVAPNLSTKDIELSSWHTLHNNQANNDKCSINSRKIIQEQSLLAMSPNPVVSTSTSQSSNTNHLVQDKLAFNSSNKTNDKSSLKNSNIHTNSHISINSLRSVSSPQLSTKPLSRSKVYRKASLKSSITKLNSEQSYLMANRANKIQSTEKRVINISNCTSSSVDCTKMLNTRPDEKHTNNKEKEDEYSDSKNKWNIEDVHITCNPLSTPYPYSTPCHKTINETVMETQEDEPKSRSCGSFLPILSLIPQTVISFQYLSPKMKFSWWRNKIS